ncbi:MAG: PEGA domain-containing protein, partial [Deltaproteobacteria bacterium]|nr:PEGA domain-containing protein [Deltaproteobacteria bacterium]
KRLATTPIARPIILPIGKHHVVLENPYYKPVSLNVTIRATEAQQITKSLERADTTNRSSSP